MKRIAHILFFFLATAPVYGQITPLFPEIPDTTHITGIGLVGERVIPDGLDTNGHITPDWALFDEGTVLRGYDKNPGGPWYEPFGHADYTFVDCTVNGVNVNGFLYGNECYAPAYLFQVGTADPDAGGNIVFGFVPGYFVYDNSYDAKTPWDYMVKTGKLIINQDTLAFVDALPFYWDDGRVFLKEDGCGNLPGANGVCWDDTDVVFRKDDILDIQFVGKPLIPVPPAPSELGYWQHRTSGGSRIAGSVWLSWHIPVVDAQDPVEQVRLEKQRGMHYQYRMLRDGDGEWNTISIQDTKLGVIEERETLFGSILSQRRKYLITGLDPNGEYSFCIRAANIAGTSDETCNLDIIMPVSVMSDEVPGAVSLAQNYPNPFNPVTTVAYRLDRSGPVQLVVYDLTGRIVSTLVDGVRPAGSHEVRFDADGLPTGTYVYRLHAGSKTLTQTMTLTR